MAETFTLPSFAKINWFLRVRGRRPDGFHELCTLFQTISLFDELTFTENSELALTCDGESVPVDETNLVIKAANLLREKFNIGKGAAVYLKKRIPAPGGLGGGSSNAAVALLGLATLWDLDVSFSQLIELGAALGSDVPFFFYGGTAAATGRGTLVAPVEDVSAPNLLIVTPPVSVSTADAFARLNAPDLTKTAPKSILQFCQNEAESFRLRQSKSINDFENSVFQSEPEIKRVKNRLLELGAVEASLSGSGASVFAVFDKEETRQATLKALENENWRKFAVATVSRTEYRDALKPCGRLFPISF